MVHIANVYIIFLPDFRIVNPINGCGVKIIQILTLFTIPSIKVGEKPPTSMKVACPLVPRDSKNLSFVDARILWAGLDLIEVGGGVGLVVAGWPWI